jgi:tetratricopeptide (TPR) repeat protein
MTPDTADDGPSPAPPDPGLPWKGSTTTERDLQLLITGHDRTLDVRIARRLGQAARSVAYLALTFGREDKLALLDAAWASGDVGASAVGASAVGATAVGATAVGAIHPSLTVRVRDESPLRDVANAPGRKTNVVTIVAVGGTGKTALVKHWLARMAADGHRGATHVLGWSFYSQGAREDGGASSDPFIDYGLRWFGDTDPARGSPWEKGERLAAYFAATRSLLVLDGMEPLQYLPGVEHAGRVRDPALAALLTTLAYGNAGLCVVTTREPVADVAECIGQTVIERDLRHLTRGAAVAYLRRLGVQGEDAVLAEAADAFGGHALALTLLGGLLVDFCDGDVRRWREAGPRETDESKGLHAQHVMAAYEHWLGEGPERAILRLMGLFDRPASAAALDALRASPPIPGQTGALFDANAAPLSGRAWDRAVLRLQKAWLLEPRDAHAPGEVDAHPLVREHFGAALEKENPAAFREGHARLYDFYRAQAPDQPDTLSQMAPLFAAVGHGCVAGRRQEALDAVYWRHIQRGNKFYSVNKLGGWASDLAALAGFFERAWDLPARELTEPARAFLLNAAGFRLRALGRAAEAEGPMRAGLEMYVAAENWKAAAIAAGNLSELALALGDVAGAVSYAEQAVAYADKSGDAFLRSVARTQLADARAQAGTTNARALFAKAERMQAEQEPEHPLLYSLQGYRYCDLLLDAGDYWEVLRRAPHTLKWAMTQNWLDSIALDHLSLGQASAGLRQWADAARELDAAVAGLRAAGAQESLVRGLPPRVGEGGSSCS